MTCRTTEYAYTVLLPDYFEGAGLEEVMRQSGLGLSIMEWIGPFCASAPKPVEESWLLVVKISFQVPGCSQFEYWFGAPCVLSDLTTELSCCGAVAHPSGISEAHSQQVKDPLFLSCAERDPVFGTESRHKADMILAEGQKADNFQLLSGVSHGFLINGAWEDTNAG